MSKPMRTRFALKTFMDDRAARGRENSREGGRLGGKNNPNNLTPEKREAIAQALRDGETNAVIVSRHHVSPSTVSRIRRECGIGIPHRASRVTHARMCAIVERLQSINTLPDMQRRGAQLRLAQEIREGKVA